MPICAYLENHGESLKRAKQFDELIRRRFQLKYTLLLSFLAHTFYIYSFPFVKNVQCSMSIFMNIKVRVQSHVER